MEHITLKCSLKFIQQQNMYILTSMWKQLRWYTTLFYFYSYSLSRNLVLNEGWWRSKIRDLFNKSTYIQNRKRGLLEIKRDTLQIDRIQHFSEVRTTYVAWSYLIYTLSNYWIYTSYPWYAWRVIKWLKVFDRRQRAYEK